MVNLDFKSVIEFLEYFKDEETCLRIFEDIKFRNGEYCPHCNNKEIYRFSDNKRFKCKSCKKQFTIKLGTIFEGSKIELKKWFLMTYLLTSARKGISSIQLSKQVGVTQKTAWYMAHRLRQVIDNDNMTFDSAIEIDKTYIGGKESNKHSNKKTSNTQGLSVQTKAPILGMISRGENKKVKTFSVENVKSKTIGAYVESSIAKGSTIYTDEFRNYNVLNNSYSRNKVNHRRKEYVRNLVHTNNIENFWSIFKRGYVVIYHWMSREHLQRYINEFSFRFNHKNNYLAALLSKSMSKIHV